MKRLLKSSNFWNAMIAITLITIASYFFKIDNSILLMFGGLFGVRGVATGMQDYMTARSDLIGGRPNDRA